ncbi:hypothetical protein IAU59_001504 [Kwoniella sp. CBS 9459]
MFASSSVFLLLASLTALATMGAPTLSTSEIQSDGLNDYTLDSTSQSRRGQTFSKARLLPRQGSTFMDRHEVNGQKDPGAKETKTGQTLVFNWDLAKLEQDKKDDYARSYQYFSWYSYEPDKDDAKLIYYSECQVSVSFEWQDIGEWYLHPFAGYKDEGGLKKDRKYVFFPPDQDVSQDDAKIECKDPVCRGGDELCGRYPMKGF